MGLVLTIDNRLSSEDPKLFDAGDYNLFRYCHNDPLDLTDPMGLLAGPESHIPKTPEQLAQQMRFLQAVQHALGWSGGAIKMGLVNFAIGQLGEALGGPPPRVDRALLERGKKGTDASVKKMDQTGIPHLVVSYTGKDGQHADTAPQPGEVIGTYQGHEVWQEKVTIPAGATPDIIGHSHKLGDSAFSNRPGADLDTSRTFDVPVMKNLDRHRGYYDLYYRGWRSYLKPNLQPMGHPFPYSGD